MSPPPETDHPGEPGAHAPGPPGGHRRTVRRTRLVGYFFCASWSWLVVFLVVWAVLPLALQMRPLVVESDSMRPALDRGDLVVVQDVSAADAAVPGRVLTFDDPGVEGRLTTHRVDSVDDDGTIWTRGDANAERDSMPITADDVQGMARLVVPLVGLPKLWLAEGDWPRSAGVLAATFVALSVALTVNPFHGGGPGHPRVRASWRRRLRRRTTTASLGAGLVAVTLAGAAASPAIDSTAAAFFGATAATSTFETGDFSYDAVVGSSAPDFRWRLGDDPGTTLTFVEDFETGAPWTPYGAGSVTTSTVRARSGLASGLKTGRSERHGGYRTLGLTTEDRWELEAWVYRPAASSRRGTDLVALADPAFDGYGVMLDHRAGTMSVERLDRGRARSLAAAPSTIPADEWLRVRLSRSSGSLTASVHGADGSELAALTATDSTHGGADRVVVLGRDEYFVDDISVSARVGATTVAADALGRLDGTYVGTTRLGEPGLLSPSVDAAVAFGPSGRILLGDHPDLNTSARTERSLELWFRAETTNGRQVLYEEGGGTNGMLLYLDGSSLRARSWSRSTNWTNDLDVVVPVGAGTTHHVVLTLDTVTQPNLVLYLDGDPVADAAKGDTAWWSAHGDDGAIGGIQGSTRFHDGTSSDAGSTTFTGTIDEVAVYNRVLGAHDVLRHWAAGT